MLHGPVSFIIIFVEKKKVESKLSTTGQIRDADSTLIVVQMLFLEAEDSTKPIHLYINSPGGSVTAGLAIYDTVRHCPCLLFTAIC